MKKSKKGEEADTMPVWRKHMDIQDKKMCDELIDDILQ